MLHHIHDDSVANLAARPARITIAAVVLGLAIGVTLIVGTLSVVVYLNTVRSSGVPPPAAGDVAVVAIVQLLVPLTLAVSGTAAVIGLVRGRAWGRVLALAVGALLMVLGLALLWPVLREWGMRDSLSVLLIPPAAVMLIIGGFVAWAAASSRAFFSDRQP